MRRADLLVAGFDFGQTRGVELRLLAGGQLFGRNTQLLAAGFGDVLEGGLALHELDFDVRAAFLRLLHGGA